MARDPRLCAFCGDDLLQRGVSGYPTRVGAVVEIDDEGQIEAMREAADGRQEAGAVAAVRVGVCPACLDAHDLGDDPDPEAVVALTDELSIERTVHVEPGTDEA